MSSFFICSIASIARLARSRSGEAIPQPSARLGVIFCSIRVQTMPASETQRAREWVHAAQAAVCDVIEPWEHGTVVRATRHPTYWDYNVVRVEDDVDITAEELVRVADRG